MEQRELLALLERVRSGSASPEEAAALIGSPAYEDLGYARVDHHRAQRQGAAEVIFGQGKTAEAAKRHNLPVLAEMPIDPALAALSDAGDIESFQVSWLDGAAGKLAEI